MDLTPWQLIVASLATWEAVEVYHHSSLFAPVRARAETIENKLGSLLTCPFCLCVWVAFVAVLGVGSDPSGLGFWSWLAVAAFKVFGYGLAVARVANLGNDLTHHWCRTPRDNKLDLSDVKPESGESDGQPQK